MAAGHELPAMAEPQSLFPSPTDYSPREEPKYSFPSNQFAADYLNSPQKQKDCSQSKLSVDSDNINKKSSTPTALGLLLRSSIFKELMEKNSNVSEDESEEERWRFDEI